MARPQLASDEQIFDAAYKVLAQHGPEAFTLTQVAQEVGLSRAAIITAAKKTVTKKRTTP